ncbi:unnamed protein product [Ectocarpus sp. 8 AP-2014]
MSVKVCVKDVHGSTSAAVPSDCCSLDALPATMHTWNHRTKVTGKTLTLRGRTWRLEKEASAYNYARAASVLLGVQTFRVNVDPMRERLYEYTVSVLVCFALCAVCGSPSTSPWV